MGGTGGMHEVDKKCIQNFSLKISSSKITLGHTHKLKDNI
jgi:hypothetical protein